MKTKMKYSTTKISPAKMNSSASKALVKSPKLRSKDLAFLIVLQTIFICYQILILMFIHATLAKATKNTRAEIRRDSS